MMILFLDHINIKLSIFFAEPVLRRQGELWLEGEKGELLGGRCGGRKSLTSLSWMSRDTLILLKSSAGSICLNAC